MLSDLKLKVGTYGCRVFRQVAVRGRFLPDSSARPAILARDPADGRGAQPRFGTVVLIATWLVCTSLARAEVGVPDVASPATRPRLELPAEFRIGPTVDPASVHPVSVVPGITVASRTATVASVLPARIASITVREGDVANAGQVVVQLDDRVQQARAAMARATAESDWTVQLARARREYAEREWERLHRLHRRDSASSKELLDAEYDTQVRRLEHELGVFHQVQARRAYERERAVLEEYAIRSPFTGYVSARLKEAGESVDQLEGILRIVRLDPLEVVVDCPLAHARTVRVGDELQVRPHDAQWTPRTATVVFASRVADAASQTFRVKLHVANTDLDWPGGLHVDVDFAARRPSEARTGTAGRSYDVLGVP